MKFNSHPPNSVFIKAVTIKARRRAARLSPAQLCGRATVRGSRGKRELGRGGIKEAARKQEGGSGGGSGGGGGGGLRQSAAGGRQTEGLNLAERRLSLLCNLSGTCLT